MKRLLPVLMVFGVFLGTVVPKRSHAFIDTLIINAIGALTADTDVRDPDQLDANKGLYKLSTEKATLEVTDMDDIFIAFFDIILRLI